MKFRTELSIPPSPHPINHTDAILMLGSCFSQHIGARLQKYKFNCISNPFGTVFNPVSIARLLEYVCAGQEIDKGSLQWSQGLWVHPDFHSSLCDVDADKATEKINQAIVSTRAVLPHLKYIFITFGTTFAYRQKTTGQIVANCHKIAPESFIKVKLDVGEAYATFATSLDKIKAINPDVHVVCTVSPVRHIKDGIIENSRSKATLISMVEMLAERRNDTSYFPAYEWMMDDLRDYRFYDADLIHPGENAVDYIWEKFSAHYFAPETLSVMQDINQILLSCQHRPFNPASEEYKKFCSAALQHIQRVGEKHPYLNLQENIDWFAGQITQSEAE